MSISSVSSTIKNARKDSRITEAEAKAIIKAAGSTVSNGEAKAIQDLWANATNNLKPRLPPRIPGLPEGGLTPMPVLASPANPRLEEGAVNALNAMFLAKGLPLGTNEKVAKEQIQSFLSMIDLGTPLAKAPSEKSKVNIFLRDMRMVDGPREEALVDVTKKQFFLKVTGAGMAGPDTIGPFFYGPFPLHLTPVDAKTPAKLLKKLEHEESVGRVSWTNSGVLPQDVGLTRIELKDESPFDGYKLTALVISGQDPNKAKEFWVERSGGFLGRTEYAGPIKVDGRDV